MPLQLIKVVARPNLHTNDLQLRTPDHTRPPSCTADASIESHRHSSHAMVHPYANHSLRHRAALHSTHTPLGRPCLAQSHGPNATRIVAWARRRPPSLHARHTPPRPATSLRTPPLHLLAASSWPGATSRDPTPRARHSYSSPAGQPATSQPFLTPSILTPRLSGGGTSTRTFR